MHTADPERVRTNLAGLLQRCDADGLAEFVQPPATLELLGRALHLRVPLPLLQGLLDGTLGVPPLQAAALVKSNSNSGTNTKAHVTAAQPGAAMAYLPLVGVLATRYGHGPSELGGPVTDALEAAALSTRERVQELENRGRTLHRHAHLGR
jgi:hypothetical protein